MTTTAEGWAAAVRSRLGLGRLLVLGEAADGIWLAERAADGVLRRAAAEVPGVRPGRLRIGLADPDAVSEPVLPAPPGSMPPGPLRIEAEFAAGPAAPAGTPLPELAERLRTALFTASERWLGLAVAEVDLRVTALLDDVAPDSPGAVAPPGGGSPEERAPGPAGAPGGGPAGDPAAVAAAVPGVARLTTVLGPSVHRAADHLRIELETASDRRALDVARAVRTAVGGVLPVTVLVTGVRDAGVPGEG
ncbi:hypothetical protein ACLGI4_22965 [Streptomyces sp. HMX112]|uniref:hypothetical protein n=1 Tax=Streptomyces sp. HMX112 TaxID=3390850 RepID=UPI003A7FDB25